MIPFIGLFPAWWKLAAAGMVAVALAGGAWKLRHNGVTAGRAEVQTKWDAAKVVQQADLAMFNENQRHLERANGALIARAHNDRTTNPQAARSVVAAIGAELGGLRNEIYTLDTRASRESSATCIARAATARSVFEQCTQRYSAVAERADEHADDAVMFESGWPK